MTPVRRFLQLLVCLLSIFPTAGFADDDATQLSQRGIELARNGDMNAAIATFNRALQLNPEDGQLYLHLANAYLATNSLDAATQACQKAVELLPDVAETYATSGRIFHRGGKLQAAMAEYQKAIRLSPDIAEYHHDLGSIYHSLGELEAAEKAYRAALRLNPQLASVYHNLAELYRPQGRLDAAIAAYEQALKYTPNDAYTKKQLAVVNAEKTTQLGQEILRYQTAISLQPDDARNYKQLALAYYRSRQLEEAVESLRIALYLQPDSEQARFDLESVLQQKEKSLNAVLGQYLEKAQTQPENPEVHYTLGVVYLSRGEPLEATKHFRAALESAPTSAVLWLKLGEALQRSKQPEEARTAYQQALRFQPDLPAARQRLGILEKERDNLDATIEHLERAALIEKSSLTSATARVASAETHYHLGDAYHRKRQLKAAMTAYHTAIRLKPDAALAYLRLAEIYEEMGNRGAALTFYRRFIALAKPRPELHPQMREAEKRVEIAINR